MRRMRILLPILILGFIFFVGLLLTNPSQAQNGPIWLPNDGKSQPAEPNLSLLSANPMEIELHATLPGAYAESVTGNGAIYTRLTAPGYSFPAVYGLPELPVLRREVEIPFGAQVSIEIISAQYTDHTLDNLGLSPIYPMQPPVPKVQGVEDNQPFRIDTKYYTNGALYPSNIVSVGAPYIIRGHRIVQVEVWPVAYTPSQGNLRLYSQVSFRLTLSGSDIATTNSLADRYSSPAFDPTLSQQVLNYNQGRPLALNSQTGYLIITADAYANAIAPLVTLRQSRGFDVTLTPQSTIPNGTTTAGLKTYIQTAYNTWPIPPSYVLLVGDTNTIPTWTGPVIGTSTDLYYVTMDGESDWHPDIGRGRFPVRTAQQTTNMVDKYLQYATLTGQERWLKTASFPATCDRYTVAEGTHNYVIGTYSSPGGWTGTFPTDPALGGDKLYCVTYSATHQDLIDQFNQGRWAIIYSGHGSYDGWEMSFTPTDVNNLTGYGMYPFVASHACLSGDFGQPEVFGETWVLQQNKGALVYWGSSTYSYWDEDDVLERRTFDELFMDTTPHADVTAMTYAGLAGVETTYPSSAQYYWETYNILGDPSVHLFMEPDRPAFNFTIDPSYQEVCTRGTVTSTVEISSVMNYSSTVYLGYGELPFNVVVNFNPGQAQTPYTSTLTLDVTAGALEGDYTIPITATDQVSQTLDTALNLRINTDTPATPALLSPEDGAINQPFSPAFDWSNLPLVSGFNFKLATSPLFETSIFTATDLVTSNTTVPALNGGTCYWWSAQADNACGTGAWAEPFHFSTVNLGISFFDDMESGASQWSHAAAQGIDHWVISAVQSHSPTHAWYVPDDSAVTDTRLRITTPITIDVGSTLTFWHRYAFEGTSYDGSVLELSTNLGNTWSDLGSHITANGYNGTIYAGYSNPLGGRAGWTGDLTDWTQVTVDLSSFAGHEVLIRWRLGSDSSVGDTGWYIDDVQITAPLPPNPSPTLASINPNMGGNDVPTPIVITGTNFMGSPALKLGDTWLESVVVVNPSTINAVVPAGIAAGVYDLTIYNGDCQSDVLEAAYTVFVGDEPITGLTATNDGPTVLGNLTTLTATTETGTNVTFTWNFGDGSSGNGAVATHTYASSGVYTAQVTATNSHGQVETTTDVIIIAPPQVFHYIYLPVTNK
jgi:hypothetical protein